MSSKKYHRILTGASEVTELTNLVTLEFDRPDNVPISNSLRQIDNSNLLNDAQLHLILPKNYEALLAKANLKKEDVGVSVFYLNKQLDHL